MPYITVAIDIYENIYRSKFCLSNHKSNQRARHVAQINDIFKTSRQVIY